MRAVSAAFKAAAKANDKRAVGKLVLPDTPGVNLFSISNVSEAHALPLGDSTFDIIGSVSSTSAMPSIANSDYITVYPGATYALSVYKDSELSNDGVNGYAYVTLFDASKTMIGDVMWMQSSVPTEQVKVVPSNGAYARIFYGGTVTSVGMTVSIQFEQNTKATGFEEYGTTVLDSSEIQSFSVTSSGCTDSKFGIGGTVASELEMVIKTEKLPLVLNGVEVRPQVGYMLDGVEELVTLGKFWIDDSQTSCDGLYTSLRAYDIFGQDFMNETIRGDVSWDATHTMEQNLNALYALEEYNSTNIPVDVDTMVKQNNVSAPTYLNLSEDATPRDVISTLAAACGKNAIANQDGVIEFVGLSETVNEIIDKTLFKASALSVDAKDGTNITFVSSKLKNEDNDDVLLTYPTTSYGGIGLQFDDGVVPPYPDDISDTGYLAILFDRLISQNRSLTLGTDASSSANAIPYQAFSVTTKGLPYITPLDLITIVDDVSVPKRISQYDANIMTVKHTYNGALSSEFSSEALGTSSSAGTSSSSSTVTAIKNSVKPVIAYYDYLASHNITAENISTAVVNATNLTAENAIVTYIGANVAELVNAKIDQLNVREILGQSGYFKEITGDDVFITGLADVVALNASCIQSGTLRADVLQLKGEDGLYYQMNIGAGGTSTEWTKAQLQEGILGSNIIANSITADKLKVSDLYAFGATIGGIHIADNSLHSSTITLDAAGNPSGSGIYIDPSGKFYAGNEYANIYLDPNTTDGGELQLNATMVTVSEDLTIGNFKWDTRENEHLSLRWVN